MQRTDAQHQAGAQVAWSLNATVIVLMPNDVEAYRTGDKRFEFKGTNGFVTTIDISSKDFTKK